MATERVRFSRATIDGLAPGDRVRLVWDTLQRGLGLKIHPTGRKTWTVVYRLRGSRAARQPTIGTYGIGNAGMDVDRARKRAEEIIFAARRGIDLLDEEREAGQRAEQQRRRADVAALVKSYRSHVLAAPSPRTGRALSAKHIAKEGHALGRIEKAWGRSYADEIGPRDVEKLAEGLSAELRRFTVGVVRKLYAHGVGEGFALENPVARARKERITGRVKARETFPSVATVAALIAAADELALQRACARPVKRGAMRPAAGMEPIYRDLAVFLFATGQRTGEVTSMRWRDIDLAAAAWTQPTNKSDRMHRVPLNALAIEVLERRQVAAGGGPGSGALVFSTGERECALDCWKWLKVKISATATVDAASWRWHDARRSLVSTLAEHGYDFATLDALLNHAQAQSRGGVLGVYQRASLDRQKRVAMDAWGRLLLAALGRAGSAEVIKLEGARTA